MSGIPRTQAQLEALFLDNDLGDISAQDGRDFISTFFGHASPLDPTGDNDSVDSAGIGAFFSRGSRWFNTGTEIEWVCWSGTPHLANWQPAWNGIPQTIVAAGTNVTVAFDGIRTYTVSASSGGTTVLGVSPIISTLTAPNQYTVSYSGAFPPPIVPTSPATGMLVWHKRGGPYWQDVGMTVPAVLQGDHVEVIQDSSGNGFNLFSVAPGSDNAYLDLAVQNGFPAVNTNYPSGGSGNRFSVTLGGSRTSPYTVFMAWRWNAVGAGLNNVLEIGTPSDLFVEELPSLHINIEAGSAPNTTIGTADTHWHILALEINGASSTWSLDGSAKAPWIAGATVDLTVIYWGFGNDGAAAADLGELIVYDSLLSSADYATTTAYLQGWFGGIPFNYVFSVGANEPIYLTGTPLNPIVNVRTFLGTTFGVVPDATAAPAGSYLDHTGAWTVPPSGGSNVWEGAFLQNSFPSVAIPVVGAYILNWTAGGGSPVVYNTGYWVITQPTRFTAAVVGFHHCYCDFEITVPITAIPVSVIVQVVLDSGPVIASDQIWLPANTVSVNTNVRVHLPAIEMTVTDYVEFQIKATSAGLTLTSASATVYLTGVP